MKKQKLYEQIKKLLEMGFDAELISFELEIPIAEIEKCKKQLELMNNVAEQEQKQKKENEKETNKIDYDEIINKYKEQIKKERELLESKDIQNSKNKINIQRTLNFLAFTYFKAGMINEAREELQKIIDEYGNYTAYRQLIHIEKTQGNNEDYELWLYECLDKFPKDIWTRKQLISIAKQKGDKIEQIKLLKEILDISPINAEAKIELEDMIR